MSGKESEQATVSRKKQIRREITENLRTALAGLKDILGEKKFERRIARAAKIISAGIRNKRMD